MKQSPINEAELARGDLLLARAARRADIAGAHYDRLIDEVPRLRFASSEPGAVDVTSPEQLLAAGANAAIFEGAVQLQALSDRVAQTAAIDPVLAAIRRGLYGEAIDSSTRELAVRARRISNDIMPATVQPCEDADLPTAALAAPTDTTGTTHT